MPTPDLLDLKNRWSIKEFSYETEYKPGDFCIFVTESAPPPCGGGVECDAYFDSTYDFLAWLRYCQIPSLVSWNHGKGNNYTIENDAFLSMCSDEYLEDVSSVLTLLDAALVSGDPSEATDEILEYFNEIFRDGMPSYEISASGADLQTFLSDPFLSEKLDEAIEDEVDEEGDFACLRKLIDESAFDEHNDEHVQFAQYFLESCRSF